MTNEVMDELFGDELKVYIKAIVKGTELKVHSYVEEQSW
jgi:hypothetical protein